MATSRTFKLTSPPMHGADVKLLQEAVNAQLKRWDVAHKITVDGRYTTHTRDAVKTILYGLGIAQSTIDKGITPRLRVRLRKRLLTPAELLRYRARKGWRARLVKRYGGHGPEMAVAFAKSQVGVMESPAGSNRGKLIDAWERLCGIIAAPWCGVFVNRCLIAAGFPNEPWMCYCPTLEQKARAGEGGWSWHPAIRAKLGDVALYGADIAHHMELVEGYENTYGGNTTTGAGGDQSNGGIVAHRTDRDWKSKAFPCRGVARPPYATVA